MDSTKPLLKSGSFWGSILVFLPVIDMFYQSIEGSLSGFLPLPAQAAIAALGAAISIYKRATATEKIKGII